MFGSNTSGIHRALRERAPFEKCERKPECAPLNKLHNWNAVAASPEYLWEDITEVVAFLTNSLISSES